MKHIFVIAVLSMSVSTGYAQKVKYDDLFILLQAENYRDADKFLRIYLGNDPKEPHANYSMAKMLQSYMNAENIITNSTRIVELADSVIIYYDNALRLNTEKYVEKKHDDDYYADFRRRDLRTGKFTVKLSDVQLDIEERKKKIEKFKVDLAMLHQHFNASIGYYDSCYIAYSNISKKVESKNLLYFTSGAVELQILRDIASNYDSSIYNLNTYLTIMKGMGKNAINQEKVVNTIENYPFDGQSKTDFYGPSIDIWDYKTWASSMLDVIGKQVYPLKARMVAYDEKLAELTVEVIRDTLDARPATFRLATENVGRDLEDYDSKSLPAAIFDYRISEINYRSMINYWFRDLQDTLDVGLKLDGLNSIKKQLAGLSRLTVLLDQANNDLQLRVYADFLSDRYEGSIDNYVRAQFSFVHSDSVQLLNWYTQVTAQDKITTWYNDSISLEIGNEYQNEESIKYSTMRIDSLNERKLGFYAWTKDKAAISLSFSISPSSRILDTLYSVPLHPKVTGDHVTNLHFLSDSLGVEKRVWVLNSSKPDGGAGYFLQVFTTDLSKGAGWDKEFRIKEIPRAIKFNFSSHKISFLGENDALLMILDEYGDKQELPSGGGQ